MEQIRNENGTVIDTRPYDVHEYTIQRKDKVQGYALSSYMPKNKTQQSFVRWTFDCVADQGEESAVAEQKAAMQKERQIYPAADFECGALSWEWPQWQYAVKN